MKKYNNSFYQFTDDSALSSAETIIKMVFNDISPKSVLDVGCANGAWLTEWKNQGVLNIYGLDGIDQNEIELKLKPEEFQFQNLAEGFDLNHSFDLVQSLEVAEHIDIKHAETFIKSICQHGNVILFSAATPGQGGDHHVNEQPFEYWRDIFTKFGFSMYDPYRHKIAHLKNVSFWYRYNLFIFIRSGVEESYPNITNTAIPRNQKPVSVAPLSYKLRCQLIKALPQPLVHVLANMKRAI